MFMSIKQISHKLLINYYRITALVVDSWECIVVLF